MLKIKLHWQILIALLITVLYDLFLTDYAYLVTWIGDLISRMVPTNIFEALVSFNILAIIFFSILFCFFITRLDSKSKDFLQPCLIQDLK